VRYERAFEILELMAGALPLCELIQAIKCFV